MTQQTRGVHISPKKDFISHTRQLMTFKMKDDPAFITQPKHADKIGNENLCGHKSHRRRVIMHLLHDHITNPLIRAV